MQLVTARSIQRCQGCTRRTRCHWGNMDRGSLGNLGLVSHPTNLRSLGSLGKL